jgi:hypothetical protein
MSNPMIEGRRADSGRRRPRVIKALNSARTQGHDISVSAKVRDLASDATRSG